MTEENLNERIRVLVVDDSELMRRQVTRILEDDPQIEVIGGAKDGEDALKLVDELRPDVVTLDVEMPKMNGITALKHIMVKHTVPSIMISALTQEGSKLCFDALRFGAVDVVSKPSRLETENLDAQRADIIAKVKRAAIIRTGRLRCVRMPEDEQARPVNHDKPAEKDTRFIGIGAGTGGYYSLLRIVPAIGNSFKDTLVVVLNVAPRFIAPFVAYLQAHSTIPVKNLLGIAVPKKGTCYLCAGDDGLVLETAVDGNLRLRMEGPRSLSEGPGPIDKFFESMVDVVGNRAVGIVMTGEGGDGAEGMAKIRGVGGTTIVQDINNCVDPSMPLATLERGPVGNMIPDYRLADFIVNSNVPS